MNIRYSIELQDEQRQLLEKITSSGTYSARQIKRAQILLKLDRVTHWSYAQLIKSVRRPWEAAHAMPPYMS